jgi:hypothetical protein
MDQLLLRYWWLLILAIIIIAFILKNVIKLVISLVVLIILVEIFWQIFIASGFKQSNLCFNDAAASLDVAYQKEKTLNPGMERNQMVCASEITIYQSLLSCLRLSKQENGFSFAVFSSLPKFNKTINDTVINHNTACPESPLETPSF